MTGRILLRFSPIAVVLVAAACGGGGAPKTVTVTQPAPTTTPTATRPAGNTKLTIYFLLNGKLQPVRRVVPATKAVAGAAFDELQTGPTPAERGVGLTNAVPTTSGAVQSSATTLSLNTKATLNAAALGQVVYTLTQLPGRPQVEVNGKAYTRAGFEGETPAILVESPLPFQAVRSPLRATGTANTFEATFQYELTDENGNVLGKDFVTATSGSGIGGTFAVTIPFAVPNQGPGQLTVFEVFAKDGSRIHQVAIPLTLEP